MLPLAILLAVTDTTAFRRAAIANPAPKTITIDGDLAEWNPGLLATSPAIELTPGFVEEGAIDAAFRATVFIGFGERDLYVAALVSDDHIVKDGWKGDMLEVLFPGVHLGISPDGSVEQFAPAGKTTVVAKGVSVAPGYTIEARVPYSLLGRVLKTGDAVPLQLAVRDVDPSKPAARAVWSGYRSNRVASFGELVLRGRTLDAVDLARCPKGKDVRVTAPLSVREGTLLAGTTPVRLRIINFQSAERSWAAFWTRYDQKAVDRDLDQARRVGANTVRVFPPYEIFGVDPKPEMLDRLRALVRAAKQRGLLVIPSLFPDKKEFQKERYAAMQTHVAKMTAAFRGERAIAMWDLMNEADHGFALDDAIFTAEEVHAWAKHMANVARAADPTHLVTIGLAGHYADREGPLKPEQVIAVGEVASLHWYFAPDRMARGLARAKEAAASAPVVLQELGVSSMYEDDAAAVAFYEHSCKTAESAGVAGFGAWELFDHPVGTLDFVTPRYRETNENHFGLLRADATAKPQAAVFCRCLTNVPRFVIE